MTARAGAGFVIALACACASAPPAILHTGADRLPPAWSRAHVGDAQVALHHSEGGSIAASISCDVTNEDAPLDVLVNHLLLQLDKPIEHGRRPIVLDGRAALRARIGVRLDGVPVELDLVVLKKDGCVIDAQLVADAAVLAARTADFERFVAGLSVERTRR